MKKHFIFSFIFLYSLNIVWAQPGGGQFEPLSSSTIVPPAPQAYQFQKYGDVPLDIKSGLPQIQVPLYSISLRDLSWNIGLRYNARGFKPSEMGTATGLGWTMEGAGIISTQVFGVLDLDRPYDEDSMVVRRSLDLGGYFDGSDCVYYDNADIQRAETAIQNNGGLRNYLPDIYNLSLPGRSLKFFFHNDTGYTIPASDVKISLQRYYINNEFDKAIILLRDEKGIQYHFSTKGYNKSTTLCQVGKTRLSASKSYVFYIDSVKTLKGDVLKFFYQQETYSYTGAPSINYNEKPDSSPSECNTYDPGQYAQTCNTDYTVQEARLDSILSSAGEKVKFIYSARQDIDSTSKLDSIIIQQNDYLLKKVLYNSYFGSAQDNNLRLKLDSIASVNTQNGSTGQKYLFQYSTTLLPPVNSLSFDYWGFYNGGINTQSNPKLFNRNPNLQKAKACILERCVYPTGGTTDFIYELNDQFGGLRLSSIEDRTTSSPQPRIRRYQYKNNDLFIYPGYEQFLIETNLYTVQGFEYQQVRECPYIRYSSHESKNNPYTIENTSYDKVTEYIGDEAGMGKVEYYFQECENYEYNVFATETQLVKKITYEKLSDNSFRKIKSEAFDYSSGIDTSNSVLNDVFAKPSGNKEKRLWGAIFNQTRPQMYQQLTNITQCHPKLYTQLHFAICSFPEYLVRKTSTDYVYRSTAVDSLTQSEYYEYESQWHNQPTKIYTVNSIKDTTIQSFIYCTDYSGGSAFIDSMKAGNVIAKSIEVVVSITKPSEANKIVNGSVNEYNEKAIPLKTYLYRKNTLVPASGFKFSNAATGQLPYQGSPQSFATDQGYTLEAEVTQITDGNIAELKSRGNNYVSYCWDSANRLIAAAINARIADIAYTSFEILGKSSFTYSGAPAEDNSAPAGKFVYALSGGSLTKNGLTTPGSYRVSYWLKDGSGSIAVNGSTGTAGYSANGWTCYVLTITDPASGQITLSGTGTIDEVRICPVAANMTTFIHHPLLGLSASGDLNNRITYYEYDGFGRQKLIRDADRHILKSFAFESGNAPGLPAWSLTGQTRCKKCLINLSFTHSIQQQEQIDTNQLSGSYNTKRWIDGGYDSTCTTNDWQLVGMPVCELDSNSQYTGYLITTKINSNPCSPYYNQQQVLREINLSSCPYQCDSQTCSGADKKCINGVCETAVLELSATWFDGHLWHCTYSYVWSDESTAEAYTTFSTSPCPLNP